MRPLAQALVLCGCAAVLSALDAPSSTAIDAQLREASAQTEAILAACAADRPWRARWMGPALSGALAAKPPANLWTCYRTTVNLERVPATALARIAADSKYWLWINGALVVREGGLKRGPTPADGYFDEVDLARHLKAGSNTIAILHWYFGKQGFSHKSSGRPGMLFDADLAGKPLLSGAGWRTRLHPAFGDTGKPLPNYRLPESNIRYDAQRDPGDWTAPGFDDASWEMTTDAGEAGGAPWGLLLRRPIPLWREAGIQEITATELKGGTLTAQLGVNQQFTPWMEVEGPAGRTIGIGTDASAIAGDTCLRAEYVTRAGRQSFESMGWLTGHRLLLTLPAEVTVLKVGFRPHGYDTAVSGAFSCSDPFFDRLWLKALRTLDINMHDTWSDCPDRERAQWWGDVVIDLGEAFYAYDRRSELLARKGLRELAGWQRPDKTLFAPIPAGNWNKELPPQILATVGAYGAWTYYLHSGDADTLRAMYPAVKSYLLTVWKQDDQGLVIHRKGGWNWADWGSNIDEPLLDNAWYLLALDGAASMAAVTGAKEDVPDYTRRAERIRQRFDAAFWQDGAYRSPGYKGDTDDRGNALAVLAGVARPERFPALRQVLARHENASPYMEKYVLEALFAMGDADLALARMKKRYQPMVDNWSTTLWEQFSLHGGTNNHAWSGGPFTLLARYVAGVANTGLAFDAFQVLPQLAGLRTVAAQVPTRYGLIAVEHVREAGSFTMRLRVPEGTRAIAGLPLEGGTFSSVSVNGAPPATAPEARDGYLRCALEAGSWVIVGRR